MNQVTLVFIIFLLSTFITAQDNTLFFLEKTPVSVSEFKYIYEKNNRDKANYTKESVDEYLDLYINFKLKVHKAKALGYHEAESYRKELMGYRSQLADSYVIDREVISRMVDEIYTRQQEDVELRHILIALDRKASQEEQQQALDAITKIDKALKGDMTFDRAVLQYSQDRLSAKEEGNIGFVHAPLPDGFIELEDAAYDLSPQQVSAPIRTDLGYHIVQVVSKRPARGTIEAQHILIRKKSPSGIPLATAHPKANQIYKNIISGQKSFSESVSTSSEDKKTKGDDGYLGFFTIGQYEKSFEDAAFNLANDGDISEPVETSIGWHIIRRISKRDLDTKEILKERIKSTTRQDDRFERIRDQVVEEIKKEASFKEDLKLLNNFISSLSDDYFNYNWKTPTIDNHTIFSFGTNSYQLADFVDFVKKNSKERMGAKGQTSIEHSVMDIYKSYVVDRAIAFAEDRLEERYPEFKNLMREYEEGILLFDIAKDMIWDKASQDTVAIKSFFENNRDNYKWEKRAKLSNYSIRSLDPSQVSTIAAYAKNNDSDKVLNLFNEGHEIIIHKTEILEEGHPTLADLPLEAGHVTEPVYNERLKVSTFIKVEEVLPKRNKSLKEAKGYVISDYQDQLDKNWIQELKSEYKVKIKGKELKRLYK